MSVQTHFTILESGVGPEGIRKRFGADSNTSLSLAFPQRQSEGVEISPSFSSAHCRQIRIYAVSKGWHAGLVVPSAGVDCAVPDLKARFVGATHYEIGWGDQGFYQAKKATLRLAFQALLASRGSVMHVVPIRDPLTDFLQDREVAETCLNALEHASLVRFIAASFARNADGEIIARERGECPDSQFFQGRGAYSMLYTCNRWTATALRSAGLDLWPKITLTSGSVMRAIRKYAKDCSSVSIREAADDRLQLPKPREGVEPSRTEEP